jgi:predicted Zn-dependent protease with MMP-like domain
MYEVDPERFSEMVEAGIEAIPPAFREQIANVEFAVEERARQDDYARMELPAGSTLLGVYRGVPLTRRGAHYHMTLPDRIVIFRQPLQRLARDEADLESRVHHVVRHEIAHYFGISDERLHELEAY